MRRVALVIALTAPVILAAQTPTDNYSIPATSKYTIQSFAGKRPLTRAERTNFLETSKYEDVIIFIDSLKTLGAKIATGSIGKTIQGRELPYVIASRPMVSTVAEARALNRPIAYIQANIHAGEVEGKEAMLAMLRDLLFDKKKNVLDSIVLIVQPIYNADGNEAFAAQAQNRGAQNGPEMVGTRQNSQKWNLNRDYIGADAPETKASMAALNRWNPDLFMDLHTTDGSIHGYALTYSPSLTPTSVNSIPYTDKLLATVRQRELDRHGWYMQDYGDFSQTRAGQRGGAPGGALGGGGFGGGRGADSAGRGRGAGRGGPPRASLEMMIADSIPASGWVWSTYESLARYGTNWYGLRNRISILSEAFSHDPFARRIASTYDFVGEILSYVAEHKTEVMALGKQGDAKVIAWAKDGSSPKLSLKSRMDTTRMEDVRVEEIKPLADSSRREPGMGMRQRTGIIKPVRMPVMVSFTPTLTSTLPFAYAFDEKTAKAIGPYLKLHGLTVEQLTAASSVTAQTFKVDSVIEKGRSETSRLMKDVTGSWDAGASHSLPAGTYIVRAGQPFGLLAFYLLEPESEDGLMQWSFYDGIVAAHANFPVMRITKAVTFRAKGAAF
ncbi:MAG TPA: M14 family zinc carboxypeptidase [Gemmatimonadaceae bacterium]|jgi:hypothetical protein